MGLGERFRGYGLQRQIPGRNGIMVTHGMREIRQEAERGNQGRNFGRTVQ